MQMLFQSYNFEIVTAVNGHQAYEKVTETFKEGKEKFDIIVLDLNMPISNGYEACEKILKLYNKSYSVK